MSELFEAVTAPFGYAFMLRGLAAAVIVGGVCAVVGTYVVLRGMAFFGDALAHAILPGVAVGYVIGAGTRGPLMGGALAAAVVAALAIGTLTQGGRLREDTAIGVIFAGMFALGIALISTVRNYTVDLTHFLFGDVLGVSGADLWLTLGLGALVVIAISLCYHQFLVISFDPLLAVTLRLRAELFERVLLLLVAVTIVVALQTVGIALMVAMLVTPAATAQLLTRRLPTMMLVAAAIGAVSAIAGLYISFYTNVASGAAIVLVCTAIFVLTFLSAPRHGLRRRVQESPPGDRGSRAA